MEGPHSSNVVENERQNPAMENHMEGLHTDERGGLLGYQWRPGIGTNDVPQNGTTSADPNRGRHVA